MQIGILGTGNVGQSLGTAFITRGHDVMLGSRSATNERAAAWARTAGGRATHGTFSDAAAFGEIVFNCTSGMSSLDALRDAGTTNLAGKPLVDVANPLDFSQGMPPTLSICNTESLAERIQSTFPDAQVVKTLNTVNAEVMVNPAIIPGEHDLFLSGNDPDAKARVADLLRSLGWQNLIDLGDISTARGPEMLLPLWLRLWAALRTANLNVHVAR